MSFPFRRYLTNVGWVLTTIAAIIVLTVATTAFTGGVIPMQFISAGLSVLAIAAFVTYLQSLAEA